MKIEEIKTIVKLMTDNELTEFKIETESFNLCIKREPAPVVAAAPSVVTLPAHPAVPSAEQKPAAAAEPASAAPSEAPTETIDSPLVGTFYRASSPDAAAFVKVGDRVSADTVVGIIEAMKVMNEIKAEKCGVIKDILVENGQPVEYGQPLIVIE